MPIDGALRPVRYLMRELGVRVADWAELTEQDKDDLRQWARDELEAEARWKSGHPAFFGAVTP